MTIDDDYMGDQLPKSHFEKDEDTEETLRALMRVRAFMKGTMQGSPVLEHLDANLYYFSLALASEQPEVSQAFSNREIGKALAGLIEAARVMAITAGIQVVSNEQHITFFRPGVTGRVVGATVTGLSERDAAGKLKEAIDKRASAVEDADGSAKETSGDPTRH